MFYTYVLQSYAASEIYIGYCKDLKRRLREHNQGLNPSTKRYVPWKLVYYEACLNLKDARRRERYFKLTQGRILLKRRLKEFYYEQKLKDLTN